MEVGNLVLLYLGGNHPKLIRGFHGLARVEGIQGDCLDQEADNSATYRHGPVRKKGRTIELGIDLQYLARFPQPIPIPRVLNGTYTNKTLKRLGTGRMLRGTVHALIPSDFRALSRDVGVGLVRALDAATGGNTVFTGFDDETFNACETGTSSIKKACGKLESLRMTIEPRLRQLNSKLHGLVSRPRVQGGKKGSTYSWQRWAWLMFTDAPLAKSPQWKGNPLRANLKTQLTVNISRKHLYVGLKLKQRKDVMRLRKELENEENKEIFDSIVASLSSREWIITERDEHFDREEPQRYEARELRSYLLDPELDWFNARFDRNDPAVNTGEFADRVADVFTQLYNVYALARGYETVLVEGRPPTPRRLPLEHDDGEADVETDEELGKRIEAILSTLGTGKPPPSAKVPGSKDTYKVKRTVLPINPKLVEKKFYDGKVRSYYLDAGKNEEEVEGRIESFDSLRATLNRIALALRVDSSFLQILVTNPKTDARYLSVKGDKKATFLLVNLLRFEKDNSEYFWLVTIAREIAYIFARRLNYYHQKIMRNLLASSIPRLSSATGS